MLEVELTMPTGEDMGVIESALEEAITDSGLEVTLRSSLTAYPGCIHWHLKRGRERGVLELTLWPEHRRAWFSVHRNRSAPWIRVEMERLGQAFTNSLGRGSSGQPAESS